MKKVEDYDGGKALHDAQWTYIGRAVEAQSDYFANGIIAALLAPLALLLLSLQLLKGTSEGAADAMALGLILSEILCLALLVGVALVNPEPTAEWIENRVRTELFRREQYLLLAGVGPYLDKQPSEAAAEALRRRGEFEGADTHELPGLVPMQESSGLTWLEALHRKSMFQTAPISSREWILICAIGSENRLCGLATRFAISGRTNDCCRAR